MFVFRTWLKACMALLAACSATFILPASARADGNQAPVKIGMCASLFRDIPAPLMNAMMGPFGALMKSQTGMDGKLLPGGESFDVARELSENKLDLAVFHGIEFAWIKQKYPQIEPLMIAVNQERHFRVHLIVRADDKLNGIADLAGAKLALPKGTREHSRLFLHKHCQTCAKTPETLFGKISVPATVEDALDELVDGDVQAVVVESVPFATFAHRKPGRAAHLRSLAVSEIFPSGVIAYNPGKLDEETLQRFRDGMTNASKNIMGRQMLMLWKLTSFEAVPADYAAICADIVKHYPAPIQPANERIIQAIPVKREVAKPITPEKIAAPPAVDEAPKANEAAPAPKAEPETEAAPLEPADPEPTPPLPEEAPVESDPTEPPQ